MNRNPLLPISAEHQATYERDGVVCVRGMFDQQWCDELNKAVTDAVEHADRYEYTGPSNSKDFVSIIYLWRHSGLFRDYILESPAAEIVGRVLGCQRIRAFQDHLFIKPIGSPHIMPWHHDMTTWPMSGHQVPTLWLALSPVTQSNGRLEFVAGYYKKLVEEHTIFRASYLKGDFGPSAAPVCPDFNALRNEPDFDHEIVGYDLEPGDIVLFHPRTPHGSGDAINAEHPRIGLSSRWIGDDIRWKHREGAVDVPGLDSLPVGEHPSGELFPVVWERPASEAVA